MIPSGQCSTAQSLFRTIANTLGLPSYFGFNWDALDECLADFPDGWGDPVEEEFDTAIIVFADAAKLLSGEAEAERARGMEILLDILQSAVETSESQVRTYYVFDVQILTHESGEPSLDSTHAGATVATLVDASADLHEVAEGAWLARYLGL